MQFGWFTIAFNFCPDAIYAVTYALAAIRAAFFFKVTRHVVAYCSEGSSTSSSASFFFRVGSLMARMRIFAMTNTTIAEMKVTFRLRSYASITWAWCFGSRPMMLRTDLRTVRMICHYVSFVL